jgi:hypothetical protein
LPVKRLDESVHGRSNTERAVRAVRGMTAGALPAVGWAVSDRVAKTETTMGLPRSGGCLCGAVRYEVGGPLRDVVVCHCSHCRRTHGHVAAYAACRAPDLRLVADDGLRWYEDGDRRRGFCGRCGASLFWRAPGRDTISVAAGTLDPPTGLRTVAQIFVADAGDYYDLPAEGERHAGPLPRAARG